MKNQKKYKAFTLLEILISIIILGIIAVMFPIMFQTVTNSNKLVLKEEIFFEEFSILSLINQRYFDENNTKENNFYKDVNATNGDIELLNNYSSTYAGKSSRIGKVSFNNNELRSGTTYTTSSISSLNNRDFGENNDPSTWDDVDDFNGYEQEFLGHKIKVSVKYIDDESNYSDENITFKFNYNSDKNGTNIKLITIWSNVGDTTITLRYPTSNIGASKFLSLEEVSR